MWEGVWDQDVGPKTHNLRMPPSHVTSSDKQAAGCDTACPTDQVLLSSVGVALAADAVRGNTPAVKPSITGSGAGVYSGYA